VKICNLTYRLTKNNDDDVEQKAFMVESYFQTGNERVLHASYKTSVIYYFFYFDRINLIKTQKSNYETI
jgi:hypothetical protein